MASAFHEFLRNTLFAQKVMDLSADDLGDLFERSWDIDTADAALACNFMIHRTDRDVADAFRGMSPIPRVLVCEVLGERGPMAYSNIADSNGYKLHRCVFIDSPEGEIAAMEFHKKG